MSGEDRGNRQIRDHGLIVKNHSENFLGVVEGSRVEINGRRSRVEGKSAGIDQHKLLHHLRVLNREINSDPAAQRIAHQRGLCDFLRLHEAVKKVDERSNLVIDQRLIRMSETDLVGSDDVIVRRKWADVRRPDAGIRSQSVEQDNRGTLPSLVVMNALPEHRGGLLCRHWRHLR